MVVLNVPQWILGLPRVGPYTSSKDGAGTWSAIASASNCCEALSNALPAARVVFPEEAPYTTSVGSYFSLRNAELHPACVLLPQSALEVSAAVRILTLGASVFQGQCQFGVRGGGRTPFAGAANTAGGIVFDLKDLPSAGLSSDHETITVSPSTPWDVVYEALGPHNRSAVGTKASGVGVGGSTTACGVSYFSTRYGYICDMIEDFEVVLATGDIIHANSKTHSDLWKALRGGINNYGIITAVTIKTFEQGPISGGQTFHDVSHRQEIFKEHAALATSYPYDGYAHFINTLLLNNNTCGWAIANAVHYTKSNPPEPEPEVFKPFLKIPRAPLFPGLPTDSLRIDNITSYSREYDGGRVGPKRRTFASISFGPDQAMMEDFFQMARKAFEPFCVVPGFVAALNYQAVPTVMSQRRGAVDSLGPIQTQGIVMLVHIAVASDGEAKDWDDQIDNALETLWNDTNKKAASLGLQRTYTQATYAGSWQNPFEARSKSTIVEMRETARKYDPLGVFQKQVPGGFKLP